MQPDNNQEFRHYKADSRGAQAPILKASPHMTTHHLFTISCQDRFAAVDIITSYIHIACLNNKKVVYVQYVIVPIAITSTVWISLLRHVASASFVPGEWIEEWYVFRQRQ